MPITQPTQHQRVTLYFGDVGTGDLCSRTDIMSALGSYVHLVANSSKKLDNYPLVFTDKVGLQNFLLIRKQNTTKDNDLKPVMTGDVNKDVGSHFLYALRNVRVVASDKFTFSSNQKIYIVGHGSVGRDIISIDKKVFSMSDIVKKLIEIGVPKDINDIRLTSCHSANTLMTHNLNENNLTKYSHTVINKKYFLGIHFGNIENKAPAKYLSDALAENKFNNVIVTGYHGFGIHFDGLQFPTHKIRNPKHPCDLRFDPNSTVRRSNVAQTFMSEIDY